MPSISFLKPMPRSVRGSGNQVSLVRMAATEYYGVFWLTRPWNAASRKDGVNGRLQKVLSSGSSLESVRNSGTADGCRVL